MAHKKIKHKNPKRPGKGGLAPGLQVGSVGRLALLARPSGVSQVAQPDCVSDLVGWEIQRCQNLPSTPFGGLLVKETFL